MNGYPAAILCAAAGLLAAGCPRPPVPVALAELRLAIDSPVAAEAGAKAPEAIAEARRLLGMAEESWEDGDIELAADIALLAHAKVRLAVALARQSLARERTAEARLAIAEAEATYAEVEAAVRTIEPRLERLWAHREEAGGTARDAARRVEEEALRAERMGPAERAEWERSWRTRARRDAFEARRVLDQAVMLGAAEAYPEATRMAVEAVETAQAAVETSPFRIERPLVDYAGMQAAELLFRVLSLHGDDGPAAYARRIAEASATYRVGFDPPFHVGNDPRAVVLALEAREVEIDVAFPGPVRRALDDLRTKWTADPSLSCIISAESMDPACGDECGARMRGLADRLAAEIGPTGGDRSRIRTVALGYAGDEPRRAGLPAQGVVRLEIRVFPRADAPAPATTGHTRPVAGGSP